MQVERQKGLINKLNQLDAAKVRFHDAKHQLLKEGYSEDEIAIAVASASFDGKVNEPKKPREMEQVYTDHPADAAMIAKRLLLEDAEKRQREARRHTLSVAAWGSRVNPMSVRSMVTLADTLDIPLFKLGLATIIIVAVLYGIMQTTHLIDIDGILVFLWVYGILLSLMVGYKLIMMGVRTARLRASVDGKSAKLAIVRSVMTTALLLVAVALMAVFAYATLFI